jgi:spore coat protein U-like protein
MNSKSNLNIKAKTTSALTFLVATIMICQSTANATATTSNNDLVITTSVGSVCSVLSSTNLTFAVYDNIGTSDQAETSPAVISSTCSTGTTFQVSLNDTSSAQNDYYMSTGLDTGTAQRINFKLFATSARNGTAVTKDIQIVSATGTGSSANIATLWGKITASQINKDSGSYSKTLTLNIIYGG